MRRICVVGFCATRPRIDGCADCVARRLLASAPPRAQISRRQPTQRSLARGAFVIVAFRSGKSPDQRSSMRYNRVMVASGTLRTSAFGVRHAVVVAVVLIALIWAGFAFAQEAYIGHSPSQQVADLPPPHLPPPPPNHASH